MAEAGCADARSSRTQGVAGASARGSGLMVAGAALLVLSLGVFGYSRIVEWQHAASVQAVAPPAESLQDRLPIPTRAVSRQP